MIREHRKSLARLLLLVPVMAVVLVSEVYGVPAAGASVPADPQAPLGPFAPSVAAWYDGLIQYSSVTNCASIIFGNPYQEKGVEFFQQMDRHQVPDRLIQRLQGLGYQVLAPEMSQGPPAA